MGKPIEEPAAEAEETPSLVDKQTELREKCRETPACAKFVLRLEECNTRVNSRIKTTETCHEEVIDLFECVDHCVAKDLFHHLK